MDIALYLLILKEYGMEYKHHDNIFEVKSGHNGNLQVAGYASVFNVEDGAGHIVAPGAFKEAIAV